MSKRPLTILFAFLAIMIGLYPVVYFVTERNFGLLTTKSADLLNNAWWNAGFNAHIIFGGLALMIGWVQFLPNFRQKHLIWHRRVGYTYLAAVVLSSIAAICISVVATGGFISFLGFFLLGVIWFSTTITAFMRISNKQIKQHQKLMIYSYAACFAAVTLRIWLPLLSFAFRDFILAYQIVAWVSWVPNLAVAFFIARKVR